MISATQWTAWMALGFFCAPSCFAADSDGDGFDDQNDNCAFLANASQLDADNDGFGNRCDPDLDNNGTINVVDLGILRSRFFSDDPVADLTGDGVVNVVDLGILRQFFFAAPGPGAQTERFEWRPVQVGAGGMLTGFSADATGSTRVVRADTYGAYRLDNGIWSLIVSTRSMPAADLVPEVLDVGVEAIAVAPSDANRIYMALAGRVYRTDDRGDSWQRTALEGIYMEPNDDYRQWNPILRVSPTDPDTVWFGTVRDGLLRTTDGGANWSTASGLPLPVDQDALTDGIQSADVLVFGVPSNSQTLYAMSFGNGFFRSVDGGQTFSPLPNGAGDAPVSARDGSFDSDGSLFIAGLDGVWRYASGAWTELTDRLPSRPFEYGSVAVNPTTDALYVFNINGDNARSVDGGETFIELARSANTQPGESPWLTWISDNFFSVSNVQFDPVVPNRLLLTNGIGFWFADVTDSANSVDWTVQSRGIEQLVANDVIVPPGQKPILGGWDFGLRVSEDPEVFPLTHGPSRRFNSTWQLEWTPAQSGFVISNTSDHRFCCSADGDAVQAGYSEDGGRTWTKFATLPTPPQADANDPWRMSFGSIAVAADDPDNIVWAPTFNRSPFYTLDRGVTWSRVVLPGEFAAAPGSHFANFLDRKHLAADRVLGATFYYYHSGSTDAAISAGLWRTVDGGQTWTQRFNGELSPFSRFNAQLRSVPGEAGHLFFSAGPLNGIDAPLLRSVDGGATWTTVGTLTRVSAIGFGKPAPGNNYATIYAAGLNAGQYGIWRSVNNGANFSRIATFPASSLDSIRAIDASKEEFGTVYIGRGGSGWSYGTRTDCVPDGPTPPAECVTVD
ncbi:MAG: hypothetical protein AB8G17_00520 [Gammaproteobacteria bacterium]